MNWPAKPISNEDAQKIISECTPFLKQNSGIRIDIEMEFEPPQGETIEYVRVFDNSVDARGTVACSQGLGELYVSPSVERRAFSPMVNFIIYDKNEGIYKNGQYGTLMDYNLTTHPSWKLTILADRSHEHLVDINMTPIE